MIAPKDKKKGKKKRGKKKPTAVKQKNLV